MSKKTLIEAIVAALIFAVEILTVLIYVFDSTALFTESLTMIYILAIFTSIEVIYGVILLIINSKNDK